MPPSYSLKSVYIKIGVVLVVFGVACLNISSYRVSLKFWKSSSEKNETWLEKRHAKRTVTKLFLVSYMRGGSSLLGELFNCDQAATMWYEPGDAFFSHYYGLSSFNIPKNDLYFGNLTRRKLDKSELEEMRVFYENKFNCRYRHLPAEAMTHFFLDESTAMDEYVACRQKKDQFFHTRIGKCNSYLESLCSRTKVEISLKNKCHDLIFDTKKFIERRQVKDRRGIVDAWLAYIKNSNPSLNMTGESVRKLTKFLYHGLCVAKTHADNMECIDIAESRCRLAKLRSVQVNRIKMEDMEPIIEKTPDIYVIHYVRDPRAIALSRVSIKSLRYGQLVQEAEYICQRMRGDLQHRRILQSRYPDVISQVKYEDLAINPLYTADLIYSLFGSSPPKRWSAFVEKHMHASIVEGQFAISVRNATETAGKWRRKIKPNELQQINAFCADVIHALGYSL